MTINTMGISKKSISPVVATILLVIVSVVAVVAFMSWLSDYNSGLQSQGNIKTNLITNPLVVQKIDKGGNVYIYNSGRESVEILNLQITDSNGDDCLSNSFSSITVDSSGIDSSTTIDTDLETCGIGDIVDFIVSTSEGVISGSKVVG